MKLNSSSELMVSRQLCEELLKQEKLVRKGKLTEATYSILGYNTSEIIQKDFLQFIYFKMLFS